MASPPSPIQPLRRATTYGGASGLGGGGLAVLGWFLPWSVLGFGTGPQIVFGVLAGGALGGGLMGGLGEDGAGILFLCLALGLAALLLVVPVMGLLAAKDGWFLIQPRVSGQSLSSALVERYVANIHRRLRVIVIMMILTFLGVSVILGGAVGTGFWVTSVGALGGFLGTVYVRAQLYSAAATPAKR